MGKVNTVKGSVPSSEIGNTLMHEHFLFGYPGWYGDSTLGSFNREQAMKTCLGTAELVKSCGVKTVVDATPNDCGRDPEFLKEVSERSGLNIVCSSGFYFEEEGAPVYFKFRSSLCDAGSEILEMFDKEASDGIAGTGIKAGVFKLASGMDEISKYESLFFRAAARVSKEKKIPIITHTESGKLGPEQADFLIAEGADTKHIMIGHICGNTDIAYLATVLDKGVYIGFDRLGLQVIGGAPLDKHRLACIIGLIGMGYSEQIMLSHDSISHWLGRPLVLPEQVLPLVSSWHPAHIAKDIIPALKHAGITDQQINTILIENPKNFFDF